MLPIASCRFQFATFATVSQFELCRELRLLKAMLGAHCWQTR